MIQQVLIDILLDDNDYWIVQKGDDILLIAIPENIVRPMKYDDIKLTDIMTLSHSKLSNNILLNNRRCLPFQLGHTFSGINAGFPLVTTDRYSYDHKEFLIMLLTINSDILWEYQKKIKDYFDATELKGENNEKQ